MRGKGVNNVSHKDFLAFRNTVFMAFGSEKFCLTAIKASKDTF